MQDYQRLWAEWCFYLAQRGSIDKEDIYAQKVVTLLEKIGWRQFDNELERERSIPVGSSQTIRADILLHQKQNKKTIVIELKQPGIPFNDGFRDQLFSYMRQIRADVGMLIGSEIELYQDPPNAAANTKPDLIFGMSLRPEEKLGPHFVRLITKANYGTEECSLGLQNLARQYRENQQTTENKPLPHPTNLKCEPTQVSGYRGTEKETLDIIENWQLQGKKTPWGHTLIRKGNYTQAALIDACLCVEGGMARQRIARNSGVKIDRVADHIENGLKTGLRNNSIAAKIKIRKDNGETHEYIDPADQCW